MALPGIEPGSTQVGNYGYKTPRKPQCGILPLNHSTSLDAKIPYFAMMTLRACASFLLNSLHPLQP